MVQRLQDGGLGASASFTQEELDTIIDDLPLALESETLRDALPDLVSKIDGSAERTFRRLIEIARQDEERTPLLLRALREVRWSGTPTEDEFAWLIGQMTKGATSAAQLDAFTRALTLDLHSAQVSILDALAAIHPDGQIRAALDRYRTHGAAAPETTAALVESQARRADEPTSREEEPTPLAEAFETPVASWSAPSEEPFPQPEPPPPPAEEPISFDEEKPPDRLTVRTLLRSIDPALNLATGDAEPAAAPPSESEAPPAHADAPPAEAFAEAEKPPERVTARTLLRSIDGGVELDAPPAAASVPAPAEPPPEPAAADDLPAPADPITVRTLLRSLDTVKVKLPEGQPEPAQADPPPADALGPGAPRHDAVFRSLDTVRQSMQELSSAATAPAEPDPARPAPEKKPWSDLDLKALAPAERARRLTQVRRSIRTPDHRRQYLTWLFSQENDPSAGNSVRKEILEFAFERPMLLGFDHATRARLGRWIRERAAAETIPVAAVLAALRRAIWIEGEKPVVDDESRPIVDAASGALLRAPSEERSKLLGRDFSIWLFAVREFEDFEVLDTWAKDPTPGVAEGLFRALAAMAALAARVGGSGGSSALDLALGIWDRSHSDSRVEMAKAIAAGWSRGFVLDRDTFFKAFWKRAQENENQREAVLIALATFDKEIEAQVAAGDRSAPSRGGSLPSDGVERRAAIDAARAAEKGNGAAAPAPAAKAAPPPEPPAAPPVITPSADLPVVMGAPEPAPAAPAASPAPEPRKITPPPPIVARPKMPPMAPTPPAPIRTPDKTDPPGKSPFAAQAEEEEAEKEITDRYFRAKREALERAMRQAASSTGNTPPPMKAAGPPPTMPMQKPSDEDTEPKLHAEARNEDDEVTEAPDEGEGVIPDEAVALEAPKAPPAPPPITPAAKPKAATPDNDVVLPGEPLRTLAEYTGFLKALSGGSAIDELLERHAMDYRQYAACMTAWGKLLQNRPDLALRMGQLLRT